MLFDHGAESGAWTMPKCIALPQSEIIPIQDALRANPEEQVPLMDLLFSNSLPLPDHDHSLHHAPR